MSKFRNVKIGAIVLVSLFVLVWGLNFLKGLSLFKEEKRYNVVYTKVGGLENSTRVMLNGFQIGQVDEVKLNTSTFKIHVGIVLSENLRIPLKSVARIVSADLMGTKEVQLILYDTTAFHNFGDTLLPAFENDLREEVNAQIFPLRQKAEALMLSFDSLLGGVQAVFTPKTQSQIAQIFKNINLTISSLEMVAKELSGIIHEEKGSIASILQNVDSISTTLADNTGELNTIFDNLAVFSDSLSHLDLAAAVHEADLALKNVHEITNKINNGEGSLGLLLNDPKLYANLEKASKELELLMKDLRTNPKRYVHYSLFGKKADKPQKNIE
ncbi:MAG: MlaD family protein [Bacteroidales bacterium]|nr:MlaD family protein [Bacteroidales bacterium]